MTDRHAPNSSSRNMRLRKLTDWRLQLRLTGWFLAAGALALGLQYILTVNRLTEIAMEHSVDPALAFESAREMTQRVLLISMLVSLPLTAAIGILATARLAGPLHRLTRFLKETTDGTNPDDVCLRKGDELVEFSHLLNEATRTARQAAPAGDKQAA